MYIKPLISGHLLFILTVYSFSILAGDKLNMHSKQLIYKSLVCTLLSFCFMLPFGMAQMGKDGPRSVSAANTIINDYTTLTADVSSGSTSIQVASANLSANFTAPLTAGDLIFIIQMQGASILLNNDSTYGTITNYNNTGNYEFQEVVSISGNTINVLCGLEHSYTSSGRTQVIRVPRFTTLSVNGGAGITCPAWNGSTGGAVIIEATGTVSLNLGASIHANGKGFRGGQLTENNTAYGVLDFVFNNDSYGGVKGESIAGNVNDYDGMGGRFCKGAPANGGGGGNGHNCGGGGGAGAGVMANYTGRGRPDISNASYASAWNLEYNGFASSSSSGGGRGGYSFSGSNQNALSVGPNNSAWGGDSRTASGGRGGRPLDFSTGKMFLGGGGGSGDQNNSYGGNGGNGGGIIYIFSNTGISGSGTISANADNGFSTVSNGTDGAGGGGGGGTILLNVKNAVTGISISANGGNGGNQQVNAFTNEAEGPGAGGGGGYIAISSGAVTRTTNGGANGTTNSFSLTEFPPNGATKGDDGFAFEGLNAFRILPVTLNICGGNTATLNVSTQGGVPSGVSYNWYDQATGGTLLHTGNTFTTPVLSTNTTYYLSSCPGFQRIAMQVNVSPITAAISAVPACVNSPVAFTGTATSAGTITGWSWNFGDGTPASTIQNPSHSYTTAGNFTVTLTVTDNAGCTTTATQTITIGAAPSISISSLNSSGCAPFAVTFLNNTTNANTYTWNFGDGSPTSSQATPLHTYNSPGNYSVTLTATSGSGCSQTVTITNMITVNARPLSSFNSSGSVCMGDTVFFTNNSSGNGSPITSYSWNFGDGSPASSQQNPFHIYTAFGNYNVTLTANTANCNDDTTITVSVSSSPVAAFSSAVTSGCGSLNANFSNSTTGSSFFTWNFGDGTPASTAQNPVHNYSTPGTYTVTLIAGQGSCADTVQQVNYITVYNIPLSSFSASTVCIGDTTQFTNLSNGNGDPIISYSWNFGDGSSQSSSATPVHVYSSSGSYQVQLSVNTANCSDDTTITVNVSNGPVASFGASATSGCGTLTVGFTNNSTGSTTFIWDFGDGTVASTATTPVHTYNNAGIFTVTLIATQGSCSDTIIVPAMINIQSAPAASFSVATACEGEVVQFTNLSPGGLNYQWNFGDGGTSSVASPSHVYLSSGSFSVTLTAGNGTCTDDTTITLNINARPQVSFAASQTSGCDNVSVQFTNSTTGATTYSWTFGDGNSSTQMSPSNLYSAPGTYSVLLTATGNGCSSTHAVMNMITVYASPVASFNTVPAAICSGECVMFTDQSTGSNTSWNWSFQGGIPAGSALQNPAQVCYNAAGNFDVTLIVSDAHCSDTSYLPGAVHVATCSAPPKADFICSDTIICAGSCIDFVDLSTDATSWQWTFTGATPSTSNTQNPAGVCYPNAGSFPVKLVVTNSAGSDSLVVSGFIQAVILPAQPSFTQNGDTLTSTPAAGYQWYLNGIPLSGSVAQQHVAMLSGSYHVVITDANGCTSASDPRIVSLVGIDELKDILTFTFYPNPAGDVIYLIFSVKAAVNFKLSITNVIGKVVFEENMRLSSSSDIKTLDVSDFSSGVYFVNLVLPQGKIVRPLIKR
jgi:PKD repeat protein